jgi:hypothetical protein
VDDHRYHAAVAAGTFIARRLPWMLAMGEAARQSDLTLIVLEAIYSAESIRQETDVADRLQFWASKAAAEVMNLHLYGDDPTPIRFQKIAGVIANVLGYAHREEREAILSVMEN